MLKHCVFLNFKSNVTKSKQFELIKSLSSLKNKIDGIVDFDYGNNLDFEQKSSEYNSGFIVTFDCYKTLREYNEHPEHILLGSKLVSMCKGGHQGIIVFDLEI